MTNIILIGQSLTYGILGGFLGNILGIGILYLITNIMASDPWNGRMNVSINFSLAHIITVFILAILIAFISSLIPILRISKIPIKNLVLNMIEVKNDNKKLKTISGIAMLLFSIIIPRLSPKKLILPLSTLSLFISTTAVIMLVPIITKYLLNLLEEIYSFCFGNEGILAAKNIRDNKNILNNISLLAIGISALLMINTISHSVAIEVLNAYKDWKFDIMFSVYESDKSTEQILRGVEGIIGTYGAFESWEDIKVLDKPYRIRYFQGIDTQKYRDYVDLRMEGDIDNTLYQLNEGRNIIVTNMIKEKLGLNIGDTLILDMRAGHRTYRVIGFHDSIMANGSNAMISQKYYKIDMKQPNYNNFYIKTSKEPDEVLFSLKSKFIGRSIWGSTVADMEKRDAQFTRQLFIILKAFSLLAMLIGIFGVFNNYMISFIERKRSIAILRSVGLSKKQTLKIIMVEALTGGFIGGIVGIMGGILMLSIVPYVMKAIEIPIGIYYVKSFFINAILGGIIIAMIASISPAYKISKSNILDAIKYE